MHKSQFQAKRSIQNAKFIIKCKVNKFFREMQIYLTFAYAKVKGQEAREKRDIMNYSGGNAL